MPFRMSFWSRLWRTELVALAVLVDLGLAMGCFIAWEVHVNPGGFLTMPAGFAAGVFATMVIGFVPCLVLGGPLHALLGHYRLARWWTVLPLGAALGSVVFLLESALGYWGMGAGVLAAAMVHWGVSRVAPFAR